MAACCPCLVYHFASLLLAYAAVLRMVVPVSEPHADSDGARRLAELVESMPTVETAAVMRFDVYAIALGSPTIGTYDAAQLRSIREALAGLDVEAIRDAVGPISGIAPR